MKNLKHFLLVTVALFSFSPLTSSAQDRNNEDEVVKLDARHTHGDFRPGEVIVKFKPNRAMQVRTLRDGSFASLGVSQVDRVLQSLGVEQVDALMPLTARQELQSKSTMSVTGKAVHDVDLSQLYRVKYDTRKVQSVHEAIESLKQLSDVEYAEPNYLVHALGEEAKLNLPDPLLVQQWGPAFIGLPQLWKAPVIHEERPVIAILDTGVDLEHPDLKANIWTNMSELNGSDEQDDDANGFADDLHGWDFVNQTGLIGDWNGHGTHCAGIAAAVGDNGIGIKGANPDALIMPVTVMQSDGVGDIATIIKGIDYAAANGADVINMSFGGYAYSMAEEQALAKAYRKAVLVAAAGNDCLPIDPHYQCPACKKMGAPMFPAAFTFVLGVQACAQDGGRPVFSNYDNDGPVFSGFSERELYNYELSAPGAGILSTYPGGKYKAFNGTSMACPMVAGAISRLQQCKDYASKELLFGDLIYTSKGFLNIYSAYQVKDEDRKPELALVNYELNDSLQGDGDFRADAGETIQFYPTFRNAWGQAENVRFSLEMGENEDPSLITFLDKDVAFGKPLSSYAKAKSQNALRFTVNEKCVDGRHVKLRLVATCDNIQGQLVHDFVITVENGVEIGGMLEEDLTLYPNVHYIVNRMLAVPEGITLTIKPGTVIKFKGGTGLRCTGKLICDGTPDSMIVFTKADLDYGEISGIKCGTNPISYVWFKNLILESFERNIQAMASDCIMEGLNHQNCLYLVHSDSELIRCNLLHNKSWDAVLSSSWATNCNLVGNFSDLDNDLPQVVSYLSRQSEYLRGCNVYGNVTNVFNDYLNGAFFRENPEVFRPEHPSYWGSSVESIVRKSFYDIDYPGATTAGKYKLDNMLTRPSAEAHGCVWKVLVNGYDAQDQFEELPPLGVGKQKFEVYFNRPMDVSVAPNIYMGVRPPYTQNAIAEEGSWSADSTVYTAYLNITGKTATDGLNRIYVDAAQDMDHFEIPIEQYRFNVEVAAAGSMSTGLMAEPGLGKVTLNWVTDEADFEDLMGYNIQRVSETIVDSIRVNSEWHYIHDTLTVNRQLIEPNETSFVDYDVVPGETYYYTIKQLTTGLSTYSLSNPVAATPLTATKGDANGSMAVDVADVVTEIAWLTNQDPKPFIFEAADVNTDQDVNILDVVGTINIITQPVAEALVAYDNASAQYFVENGILYVETPVTLGGVQVTVNAEKGQEIAVMDDLKQFEQTGVWQNDNQYLFLAYSMSGLTLKPGRHALLRLGNTANVKDMILSDARGKNVLAIDGNATGIGKVEAMQLQAPTPNPFTTVLHIPYVIGQEGQHIVEINICDVSGRAVHTYSHSCGFGEYEYTWHPGQPLQQGLYLVSLVVDGHLMQTAKVLYLP